MDPISTSIARDIVVALIAKGEVKTADEAATAFNLILGKITAK